MTVMKKVLKLLAIVVGIILLMAVILFGGLTILEYRPDTTEKAEVLSEAEQDMVARGEPIRLLSWNIGYGCLGDNADFFMDGGKGVKTADKARIEENMTGILENVDKISPDIAFFQEVDKHSSRSEYRDETYDLRSFLQGYDNSFACNYKALLIPYPIPPIGQVESGIMTFSKYAMTESERISLPCPFSWPYRLGNLKRCLLVSRIPVENSDKELVLVNFHLEAYDNGTGKAEQTAQLNDFLNKEVAKGNYVISGGDLNQTFSNIDTSEFPVIEGNWQPGIVDASVFQDSFQIVMDNIIPSCRSLATPYENSNKANFQFYAIDGFLISKNIKIEKYECLDLDFKFSDHNPLVADLVLE